MAQRSDMARKIKFQADGVELVDLVKFGEINLEELTVEVPSYTKIVTILSGTRKINPITVTFKVRRDSAVIKQLEDWRVNRLIKDVTVIETDGTGTEYFRWLMPACELGNMKIPEADHASPTYAQREYTLYPEDAQAVS